MIVCIQSASSREVERMWRMKVFPKKQILVQSWSFSSFRMPNWPEKFPVIPKPTWGHNVRHVLFGLKLSTNSRRHVADKSFIFGIFIEVRPGGRGTHKSSLGELNGRGAKKKKRRRTCILSQGLFNRKQTTKQQQIRSELQSHCHRAVTQTSCVLRACTGVWTAIGQESLKCSHCWPVSQYKPNNHPLAYHLFI